MNASAPALTREDEVQSEIRKVRKFGRNARVVCAAIFGLSLVGVVVVMLLGLFNPGSNGRLSVAGLEPATTAQFTPAQLNTPELKVWSLLIMGVVASVWLAAMYQLYRLFGNLASGAIYTPENVRRVRQVGVLWFVLALLGMVIPFVAAVLIRIGFLLPFSPSNIELQFSLSESLNSLIAAGLILLVSWIMDVGLYEKEHADALRRDADLVI